MRRGHQFNTKNISGEPQEVCVSSVHVYLCVCMFVCGWVSNSVRVHGFVEPCGRGADAQSGDERLASAEQVVDARAAAVLQKAG